MRRAGELSSMKSGLLLLIFAVATISVFVYAWVWKESDVFCPFGEAPHNIWVRAYVGGPSNGHFFSYVVHNWWYGDTSYQQWTANYQCEIGHWAAGSPPRIIRAWTYAEGKVYRGPVHVDTLQAHALIVP